MSLDLTTNTGFGPSDLFASALSLAGNFWPFLLLGLSFLVSPWIYSLIVSATKKAKQKQQRKAIRKALFEGPVRVMEGGSGRTGMAHYDRRGRVKKVDWD